MNFETCGVGLGLAKMVMLTSLVVVTFSVCLSEKFMVVLNFSIITNASNANYAKNI